MDYAMRKEIFLDTIKDFAINKVKPLAARTDEEERFPIENVQIMSRMGLFGLTIDKKYGGAGAGYDLYVNGVRELSKVCATTGVIFSAHHLAVAPIADFGNEAQKEKYLRILTTKLGAFCLTEPNAGTDASNQQTVAKLVGDEYIINGSKIFITNAGEAEVYVIFAMTNKELGLKGISAFILEAGTPGFTVGKHERKLGIRGSATSELVFDNVHLPKENLLGKEGEGFKIAMSTLDRGRIGIAAQAVGIAEGALEETIKYVKERKQFRKTIASFQNTQFQIANMYTDIQASLGLLTLAAEKKDAKAKDLSKYAAMAKLHSAETAMSVTTKCVQLFGGYGYTREYPIERMMRDAKITEIYEGTSEVQRMVISGGLLR